MLRIAIAAVAICFVSNAALGAETWECTFFPFDGPPHASGRATIEINENELKWILPAHPMPSAHGYMGAITFRDAVLQNNKLGVVAASSQAQTDKDVGPIISADVIVLKKSTGALHEGTVSMSGVHDVLSGTCRHK
jgi:hypothetical protein